MGDTEYCYPDSDILINKLDINKQVRKAVVL